jgi:hypothetical protein
MSLHVSAYMGIIESPLSHVTTIEELLERKSSGSSPENREYGCGDPSRWPRCTLYPKKFVLTSPTSGGRPVGIVRSRTQATEFILFFLWASSNVKILCLKLQCFQCVDSVGPCPCVLWPVSLRSLSLEYSPITRPNIFCSTPRTSPSDTAS